MTTILFGSIANNVVELSIYVRTTKDITREYPCYVWIVNGFLEMMMTSKWWLRLYDSNDRLIAYYRIDGDATIDRIAATFIFKYSNIEYFKITVNSPDES